MAQAIKKIKVGDETHPIDGAFYLGTLSTVAGSAASGSYKSVRWYVSDCEGVTAPYDGMRIAIKIPLAGVGTAGAILSINGNNDADYHPLAYNVNTVLTTHFPVNSIKVFVYDASATMTCYKTANTSVSVTGVWKADSNYDSNTVITYGTMEYYFRPYNGANALYRYKFVALDKDNRVVPLTNTNVANGTAVTNITPTNVAFRPDKIWWYCTTTTIAASNLLGAQTLWRSGYNANNATNGGMAICNFNEAVPAYRLIYLCGTYNKTTGLFTLRDGGTASSKNYYKFVPTNTANITLSSYFTSGYDYILLGGTYSSNNYIQLFDNNPMFHFDGTNLVPYDSWASGTVKSVNNTSPDANGNVSIAIPTVYNGTLTIQKNGTTVSTFTANQSTNATANITVPTDYASVGALSAATNYTSKVKVGTSEYTPTSGVISLPAYPTLTDTNQTVKAGTVTFGTNDVVNFVGGGNVTVTGNATNKSVTISYTTPASLPANGGNADTVDNKHASDFRASTWTPTYTDVGAASAGHTHTLSIVASTGTANVTLAFGSSYKLTAGGNDTIFKMPVDVGFANPMTTAGDLIYGGTNGAATRLAKGTNGSVLKMVNGSPAWATDATGTDTWRNIQVSGVNILGTGTNTGALNFIDDVNDDGTNGYIGVGWMNDGGNISAYASLTSLAITEVLGYTPTSVSTYADVGAASAGHTHTGVYQPAGTYYAGNLAISTTSATNKSLTLSYLNATSGISTSYVSYPGTMNITATPAIVGQTDGGTLSLYGGSNVIIATNNSTYFSLNSQNTILNTASKVTVYASYIGINAGNGTTTGNIYASTYSANLKIKNTYLEGNYFELSTTGNIYISGPSTTAAYLMVSGYYNYLVGYSYIHITGSSHILLSTSNTGASNYVAIQRGAYASRPAVAGWQHNIRVYLAGKCYARFQLYSGTSTAVTTMSTMATMLNGCGHTTADTAVMAAGRGTASSGYVVTGIYATGTYSTSVYLACAAYAAGLTSTNYGGTSISSATVTDYVKVVQS